MRLRGIADAAWRPGPACFVLDAVALAAPSCAVLVAAFPAEKEAGLLRRNRALLPAPSVDR
jgi:hypothetical protein